MNVLNWIIPQEKIFFNLLEEEIDNVCKGAELLQKLVNSYKNVGRVMRKMKKIEHDGDRFVHGVYQRLSQTLITPLDSEDLTLLVSLFDDILDRCYAVTNRLYYFKIAKPTSEIKKFVSLINLQLKQIRSAVLRIRKMDQKDINKYCIEVHRLENLGDILFDQVSASLFLKNDIKEIIKLKEIYSLLEETSDKCEDAALAIRNIVIKNA